MGKRNHPGKSPWDSIEGWKHVEVGDEVLVGSEEFGFMGLEVLDPAELKGNVFVVSDGGGTSILCISCALNDRNKQLRIMIKLLGLSLAAWL